MDNLIAATDYEANSFFGMSYTELYKEDDGYYLRHVWSEPIGDYGTSWYAQWYMSINNTEIEEIINSHKS